MMQFGGKKKATPVTTVIPEPSYNIPLVLGGTSTTIKAPSDSAHCDAMCRPSSNRLWSWEPSTACLQQAATFGIRLQA